ncbi:NAD-dependent epimerase/dehydratase [Halothece sp. PCC 7418]|uniref:NAD-dependent epimerase/dehydratase family protein n=1 Tax=Halothece sp. (strain PCC 7418) TaxID=65093 RepID=UPI0002A07897|nr:NAD-dependent epimerase/dehydratase family protein [Halothece sp. PCC 7418]AFZ44904.1 NAD-dependent epimerase/dehydratase [Halothece sp. PCC 7418]
MISEERAILITGVAGFLGRYVARYFSEQGWSVLGIDNSPPENAPIDNLTAYHRLQLPSPELLSILKENPPQVCIHCAGRASVSLSVTEPAADFHGNTTLTFEVLNALRQISPECRFIFLSSAAVYGNPESLPVTEEQSPAPISPYGFHKWHSEQLCLEFTKIYGLPTASVRIFSAYGPGLRRQVIWDICRKAITQDSIKLKGTGEESRDFIHALDIAKALMTIATAAPTTGEVYNLSSGREVTIAELAQLVRDVLECDKPIEFDGIVPMGTPLNWQADIAKLKALNFSPSVSLEDGIKTFATWCKAELIGV